MRRKYASKLCCHDNYSLPCLVRTLTIILSHHNYPPFLSQISRVAIPLWVLSRATAFPLILGVRTAKTQISLRISEGWSESSLSAWRRFGSLAYHWVRCEDSDQTARMRRLIWVFAGRICNLVGTAVSRLICNASAYAVSLKLRGWYLSELWSELQLMIREKNAKLADNLSGEAISDWF